MPRHSAYWTLRADALDPIQPRRCNRPLRGTCDTRLVGGADNHDRIVVCVEADRGVGDVIEDDQVDAFAFELLTRAGDVFGIFGGETNDPLIGLAIGCEAREDVGCGLELETPPL